MPFSHHSHSGQFCGHATDLLEDVIKEAIRQGMEVFCMTEHMPRDHEEDLYVEELAEGLTPTDLHNTFAGFIEEARRLQEVYKRQITLLVGTEIDWIRPTTCLASIEKLILKYRLDLLIGSVHHVHTIPIDFSQGLYVKAQEAAVKRAQASGSETDNNGLDAEQVLFSDYFDAQYHMLQEIRPPVVGHFDLIRLYSKLEREGRTSTMKSWTKVWNKVLRNLRLVREYGGCLEINSAALRKGLAEPYPSNDICKVSCSRSPTAGPTPKSAAYNKIKC